MNGDPIATGTITWENGLMREAHTVKYGIAGGER
jgi:hypothetical protein